MNVTRLDIRSNSDPDSIHPWYELELTADNVPKIVEDRNGAIGRDMSGETAQVPDGVDLPDQAAPSEGGERLVYAVTTDGEFVAYDPSDQPGYDLEAHIAWYDPETDTMEMLRFTEG